MEPDVATALPSLLSDNPYLTFAQALGILQGRPRPAAGVHPTAYVEPSAVLSADVHVGPFAVIGARTRVGARTVLHAHVVLGEDVAIGDDCLLHSGVHIREGCRIGQRVILQNGSVIGSDGFGFARDAAGRYHKIPQVGVVVLEDDVEIQANTTVDRAPLGETRIGRGTKVDNLVQIAHGVTIGADTVLCAQVGIAGSSKIGSQVTLAGQVGVTDHVELGDGVIATGQAVILRSVEPKQMVSGFPAMPGRAWWRGIALLTQLSGLLRRVRAIERRLDLGDSTHE